MGRNSFIFTLCNLFNLHYNEINIINKKDLKSFYFKSFYIYDEKFLI